MPIDPSYAGRTYPATAPYEVGVEKIREFADAIGDPNPAYRDRDAARALGHPDVIAPPTFPIAVTFPRSRARFHRRPRARDRLQPGRARRAALHLQPSGARRRLADRHGHPGHDSLRRGARHDHLAQRRRDRRGRARGQRLVDARGPGGRTDASLVRASQFDDVEVGTELPAQTFPIHRADLVRYAGASGDFNVIHWNERFARSVGLPDVIAHGMFTDGDRRPRRHRLGGRPRSGRRLRRPVHPAGAGARRRRGRHRRGHRRRRRGPSPTGRSASTRRRPTRARRCWAGPGPSCSSSRARAERHPLLGADHPAPRRTGPSGGGGRDRGRGRVGRARGRRCRGAAARDGWRQQPGGRRRGLRRDRAPGRDGRCGHRRGGRARPAGRGRCRLGPRRGAGRRRGLRGVEALSGIPGLAGATPIQNVGAYGQEVARPSPGFASSTARPGRGRPRGRDCGFGYRSSASRGRPSRGAGGGFRLEHSARLGRPVRYAELAATSASKASGRLPWTCAPPCSTCGGPRAWCSTPPTTTPGAPARSSPTRSSLRRTTRPVCPDDAPRWPESDGRVKVSAAWLIERAGFTQGYGAGRAHVSSKHTLALTNRGGGRAPSLALALAREVRDGVRTRFGIELVTEPVLVDCALWTQIDGLEQNRGGRWCSAASDHGESGQGEAGGSVASQVLTPSSRRGAKVGRRARRPYRVPGQPGQLGVTEPVDVAGDLVPLEQPRA